MFTFQEEDTRIFAYSKGEKDKDGKYKTVYADPAAIRRQIKICLPNFDRLLDQYLQGQQLQKRKIAEAAAYEKNPDAAIKALITGRPWCYQEFIPNHEPAENGGPGAPVPNPETPADFMKRNKIPLPGDFSPEEMSQIALGEIGHQDLCRGFRAAFGLPDFDETTGAGCTDYMVVAVMNHWQDWLEKKSGTTPVLPISSPPTQAA